ncbi:MAG: hypothetical protein ABUL68_04445, partial [Pseudomonadota bacterium]
MMLFKARLAARAEYEEQLKKSGVSIDEMRAYLKTKLWRGSSLFYPRHGTVATAAANMVQHVIGDLKKNRTGKILDLTKRFLGRRTGAGATTASSDRESVAAAI